MQIKASVNQRPLECVEFADRWNGPDKGLVTCWLTGLERRTSDRDLAARADAGELPVLPWKGGVAKEVKVRKIGSLQYLATWQGLRGEDLDIYLDKDVQMVCSRTGVAVLFTGNLVLLGAAGEEAG